VKLKKYYIIAKVSLSNSLVYRANILPRFGFYTIFIYVFMNLWRAIYQEGSMNGYTHTQIVWYLIFTECITFACTSSIYNTMNDDIKSGAITYQLGRPMHYVFFQLANSLGQLLVNVIIFGVFAVILGFVFVGPLTTFSLVGIPALLISVTLGITLNYFFMMLIGLSAFVIEDNFAMFLIYQKLGFMLGMLLPVEFLPGWLQSVAKILPFSYIYWAPAKLFVDYSGVTALELIPRQAAWGVLAITAVLWCYRLSVRHLQVNGG